MGILSPSPSPPLRASGLLAAGFELIPSGDCRLVKRSHLRGAVSLCLTGVGKGSHPVAALRSLFVKQEHRGHTPYPVLLLTRLATGRSLNLGLSRCRTGVWKDCGFGNSTILEPASETPRLTWDSNSWAETRAHCLLIETTHLGSGLTEAQVCVSAVPNLFGPRDRFRGRQFFHGRGRGGWFRRSCRRWGAAGEASLARHSPPALRPGPVPVRGLGVGDPCSMSQRRRNS